MVARVNTEAEAGISLLDTEAGLRSGSEDCDTSCNIYAIFNFTTNPKHLNTIPSENAIGRIMEYSDENENMATPLVG